MPEEHNCLILLVMIVKYLVHRWKLNITTEFQLPRVEILSFIILALKRPFQFIRTFKLDSIHKFCILLSGEYTYLISNYNFLP